MIHEQVITKVNAPVDRGVRPLVAALNDFPNVITSESCEDNDGRGAFVSFHVGENWQQLADLVHALSIALGKDERLTDSHYSLAVEWYAGGDTPLAYLRVPRREVAAVAEAIASIATTDLLHVYGRP